MPPSDFWCTSPFHLFLPPLLVFFFTVILPVVGKKWGRPDRPSLRWTLVSGNALRHSFSGIKRGRLLLVAAFLVALLSAFLVAALAFDVVEHGVGSPPFSEWKNKKARETFSGFAGFPERISPAGKKSVVLLNQTTENIPCQLQTFNRLSPGGLQRRLF